MVTETFIVMVETPLGYAVISHSAYRKDDSNMRDIKTSPRFSDAIRYLKREVDNLIVDLEFYISSGQLPFTEVEVISATLH